MIKTLDNFKIVTKTGLTYDMATDFNVLVHRFAISAPTPEILTEKVEGRHGRIRLGKTWGERRITAMCSISAVDSYDVSLLRSEVFQALMNEDEFYVICDAEPGKRWLVEVATEWTPDRIGTHGEFTIEFLSHSSFNESIGTTLDPFTFDAELWQAGQGLILDETHYRHTTTSFGIYNASSIEIDPRELPLKISYLGVSTNLKIKNITTNEEWAYTGISNSGDTILLDGLRSTKNGLSILRDTNNVPISLVTGWNAFELFGTSGSFEITYDFRFYSK